MFSSLWSKLFLVYLVAIFIVVGLSLVFFAGELSRQMEEEYTDRGRQIIENCASQVRRLVATDGGGLNKREADLVGKRALAEVLEVTTRASDVLFAGFYGPGGEALIGSGEPQMASHFGHLQGEEWGSDYSVRINWQKEAGEPPLLIFVKPLFPLHKTRAVGKAFLFNKEPDSKQRQPLGYLSLGISLEAMEEEVRQKNIRIVGVTFGLGLLSAIFIFFISRQLIKVQRAAWEMKGPEDMSEVLLSIKKSLELLQIDFHDCCIKLQDASRGAISCYSLKKQGYREEMPINPTLAKSLQGREPVYRPDLLAEDPFGEACYFHAHFGAPIRSVLDLPFSQGTLMINSLKAHAFSQEHLGYLQALAHIMEGGFQRLEDLQQLLQAKSEAAGESSIKWTLVETLSHESRKQLNGIVGLTKSLLPERRTPEQKERLKLVWQSVELLMKLIGDVLDLSRVKLGRMELENHVFNLREILEQLVGMLRTETEEKGLSLSLHIDPQIPEWLSGDGLKLRQVLNNLLVNAIKFTERGEVEMEVEVEEWDVGGVLMAFQVQDTGIGIPAARQGEIFQAFTQADESIKRRYGGSGLGLSIAAQLVEMMGGGIHLESEEGKGSLFHFIIRLEVAEDAGKKKIEEALVGEQGPLRVLLAEDNRVNQMVTKNLLELEGHMVTTVGNGREVLTAVSREPFDLILMDINMPELNGVEATCEIRKREQETGHHIPIVALTGDVLVGDRDKFLSVGLDDYLTKPLQAKELSGVVTRLGGEGRQISVSSAKLEAWAKLEWMASQGQFSIERYVRIFLEDGPRRLANMHQALAEGEWVSLEREAHTLKGGAREFGAMEMVSMCQELEDMGGKGDLKLAAALLARVETAYEQLQEELERKVPRKGAS